MITDSKNVVNLDLKKDEKILNFSDFQKQNLKFDITKLQESYKQIIQTKKNKFMILVEVILNKLISKNIIVVKNKLF